MLLMATISCFSPRVWASGAARRSAGSWRRPPRTCPYQWPRWAPCSWPALQGRDSRHKRLVMRRGARWAGKPARALGSPRPLCKAWGCVPEVYKFMDRPPPPTGCCAQISRLPVKLSPSPINELLVPSSRIPPPTCLGARKLGSCPSLKGWRHLSLIRVCPPVLSELEDWPGWGKPSKACSTILPQVPEINPVLPPLPHPTSQ